MKIIAVEMQTHFQKTFFDILRKDLKRGINIKNIYHIVRNRPDKGILADGRMWEREDSSAGKYNYEYEYHLRR